MTVITDKRVEDKGLRNVFMHALAQYEHEYIHYTASNRFFIAWEKRMIAAILDAADAVKE